MLPAHIVDSIREREARRRVEQRPQPTLELPVPRYRPANPDLEVEPTERGVVIIEL